MVAALRYRHIPYSVIWGAGNIPKDYPAPKVRLLPTFFFPDGENGELEAVTDSTPIIRRLEQDYSGRSIIPDLPQLRFLNELVEDYADEWLTKAMFHFRWAHEADWRNAGPLLVYWNAITAPADGANAMAAEFTKRQIDRLYVVGSNDTTAQTIEDSYSRLIGMLDKLVEGQGFLFGSRPASADFAMFGQLTQLTVVEPTSAKITNEVSQRVRAWVDVVEDLSGLEPSEADWIDEGKIAETMRPLLEEIGRTYVPAMMANAAAILADKETFETEIDNRAWTQPVFKYQAKCLGQLRHSYSALTDTERESVDAILKGTGCEQLVA